MHFLNFGTKKFQTQCRQNKEKQIEHEMSGGLSDEQVNAGLYDSLGVPSKHPSESLTQPSGSGFAQKAACIGFQEEDWTETHRCNGVMLS